jgi:hypothetical protein
LKFVVRPRATTIGWQEQQEQQQFASHCCHQVGGMPNYETITPFNTHF